MVDLRRSFRSVRKSMKIITKSDIQSKNNDINQAQTPKDLVPNYNYTKRATAMKMSTNEEDLK